MPNRRLPGVMSGYIELDIGYIGLQKVTRGYIGLHRLHRVTVLGRSL